MAFVQTGETSQRARNMSLAERVADGLQLQKTKPKSQPRVRIVDIISEQKARQNCPKGNWTKSSKTRLGVKSAVSHTITTYKHHQTDKPKRCPLRIAELAEPPKRRCIETWRDKSNILPDFMLDRLKMQVMDQKVIAHIPDAIECFKIKPPKKPSCRKKYVPKTSRNINPGQKHTTTDQSFIVTETKTLCSLFGNRIAKRLILPNSCSKLTHRLEMLSNVVANDLCELIFSHKRRSPDFCYDAAILEEMSNQVAFWITDIMKDSEIKLIEEELKAAKKVPIKNKDINTLIETYYKASNKWNIDLQEEEGPVLDIVDSIISNALDICSTKITISDDEKSDSHESSGESTSIGTSASDEEDQDKNVNSVEQTDIEQKEAFMDVPINQNEAFMDVPIEQNEAFMDVPIEQNEAFMDVPIEQNEAFMDVPIEQNEAFMDRTIEQNEIETDDALDIEDDKQVSDVIDALEETLDERRKIKFSNVDHDNGTGESSDGGTESIGVWQSNRGGQSGGWHSIRRQQSGGWQPHRGGEANGGWQRRNDRGWHSDSEWGPRTGHVGGGGGTSSLGGTGPMIKSDLNIGKRDEGGSLKNDISLPQLKSSLSEISFRTPNSTLLSEVDEPWPKDLSYTPIKASSSRIISKSIASLGYIPENDEGYISQRTELLETEIISDASTEETMVESNKFESISRFQITQVKDDVYKQIKVDNEHRNAELEIHGESAKGAENVAKQTNTSITDCNVSKNVGTKSATSELEIHSEIAEEAETVAKQTNTSFTDCNFSKNLGNYEYLSTRATSETTAVSGKNYIKITEHSEEKRVTYSLLRCGSRIPLAHNKREIHHKGSVLYRKRQKARKYRERNGYIGDMAKFDSKKWCADLQQTVENLSEWHRWLDVSSKKVLHMKQEQEAEIMTNDIRPEDLTEWQKLKSCIDKDALLWRKLKYRSLEVLKSYHECYTPLIETGKPLGICKKRLKRQSVMETLYTIEGLSLWLHRTIVSTENSLKCSCTRSDRKAIAADPKVDTQPSCSRTRYY